MKTRLGSVQTMGPRGTWPVDAVYIGMPCKASAAFGIIGDPGFGKPWACKQDARGWQVAYRSYLYGRLLVDEEFAGRVRALKSKLLLCWCTAKAEKRGVPVACHGEILREAVILLNM